MNKRTNKRIGEILVEVGMISQEQLAEVLKIQKKSGKKVGEVLIEEGYVTENDIIQALELQLGIQHVRLDRYDIDPSTSLLISESLARRYVLIPIRKENEILTVAMSDPLNVYAIDDVKIFTGFEVHPVIATSKEILKAVDKYYSTQKALQAVEEFKKEQKSTLKINSEEANNEGQDEINNAPAVRLVNSIIEQAVRSRASDIHIEPFEEFIKIRYRTDGALYEVMRPEIEIMPAISARLKIIGGMNIAEKRFPQDGRISVEIDERDLDLRVSILPTIFGEKIVIRIADQKAFLVSKDELGFREENKKKFEQMLQNPHGVILVTGPTGSGKTTTLYSAIQELNKPDINIITVEDPVESMIEGVNQVQVNYKIGFDFAMGLRSILRQDPNVIMVGEIRDAETAEIAIKSAMTGHLVLSTLHTNDAVSTVLRLIDMGIERYMVSSSVVGVISQRLIRKICDLCKEPHEATEEEMEILGIDKGVPITIYKGKGCPACNNIGYKGRMAVFEVLSMTKKHRELINKGCTVDELKDFAISEGMITMKENVKMRVLEGFTTVEEIVRITYSNE